MSQKSTDYSFLNFSLADFVFPPLLRCGHCKQFVPTYEKIAQTLKENDPPIPVAKVDATKASAVAGRFDVSGYPTIKILKNGQPVDYEGDRTEAGKTNTNQMRFAYAVDMRSEFHWLVGCPFF